MNKFFKVFIVVIILFGSMYGAYSLSSYLIINKDRLFGLADGKQCSINSDCKRSSKCEAICGGLPMENNANCGVPICQDKDNVVLFQ